MIYDGDCGFCRRWIARWKDHTGDRIEYVSSQKAAPRFPEIAAERFAQVVVLVDVDGRAYEGAEAVFRALAHVPGGGGGLAAYRSLPGFRPISDALYAFVASHRTMASRVTRWLWGNEVRRPHYELVRWLFLRGLGLVYLTAFASIWAQLDGLYGSRGILPVAPWLDAVAGKLGASAYWQLPSVFWFGAGDTALQVVGAAGVVVALLLTANVLPGPAACACWLLYLSIYSIGRTFLGFQWDILLLETGVLAILMAPWQIRPRFGAAHSTPPSVIWLLRWLVFRLMFLSGMVKLLSQDPAWWHLTALSYHYETQPLPAWTSWYMHQLPMWFHRLSCAIMFAIELLVPWLVFFPRRPRLFAFAALVGLQVLILATGNYGFFNLLSILLCVSLLDDAALQKVFPMRVLRTVSARDYGPLRPLALRAALAVAVTVILLVSSAQTFGRLYGYEYVPRPLRSLASALSPLHLTSNYGLFAVMTKSRPEIILEGSNDGEQWTPYEFRWKPGDLYTRPMFVAPHQPRLDWQMWFAALGDYRRNPWLISLMRRLLEGSGPVLGLLGDDPFPDQPPRYVRAVVYDYRFTDMATHAATDAWWARGDARPYAPTLRRD